MRSVSAPRNIAFTASSIVDRVGDGVVVAIAVANLPKRRVVDLIRQVGRQRLVLGLPAHVELFAEELRRSIQRAESAELARIGRQSIRWSLHYMVSPLVEPDPDGRHARCHWYLWELARVGEHGEAHWIGGWYASRLKKSRKGWRFTHVRLHLKLLSPHADGWTTLPATD